jgi:DNA-directed RNA polymerase specialized sigma subunit, sigma24 homolog
MHTLSVYNTIKKQYETITVTEEIYTTYRRTEWNIQDDDKRFSENQTTFSDLIGDYETFREFINPFADPAVIVEKLDEIERLHFALSKLEQFEFKLINAIYFNGNTEREYAMISGIPQKTINDRKHRILENLKIFLK